jgi:hypothetical protein
MFYFLQINLRLEDVYIGMMALILNVPFNDMSSFYLNQHALTIEAKSNLILTKGVKNLFFIYENTEFKYYWDLLVKNGTTKQVHLDSLWSYLFIFIFNIYLISN